MHINNFIIQKLAESSNIDLKNIMNHPTYPASFTKHHSSAQKEKALTDFPYMALKIIEASKMA